MLDPMQGHQFDAIDLICVCDDEGHLLGAVPLPRAIASVRSRRLGELMLHPVPSVHPDEDQEKVASIALHHRLEALPVVDTNGFLLGVVPPAALLSILRREHVEDIHRLAGIQGEAAQARHALFEPPVRRAEHRLPWLLVGLAGSVLATVVMASFEHALQNRIAVAFFVPGLVYLADAIGTQTEAVAVRSMSLSHAPLGSLLAGELRTGLLIGLTMGCLVFALIWIGFGDLRLAFAVAVAVLFAGAAATSIGLILPWTLQFVGKDPALGSGPLATVIQDVLSLLIYFAMVTALMEECSITTIARLLEVLDRESGHDGCRRSGTIKRIADSQLFVKTDPSPSI